MEYKKQQIPYRLKTLITLRDNGICQVCGRKGKMKWRFGCYRLAYQSNGITFEISHIVPESKGGKLIAENLVLLCRRCNRSIGDKLIALHTNSLGKT